MLREGWDVQNVTVIVGLRPYTSKANILPEQTIGRGLRLMFRDQGSTYIERVDVIGNKKFIEFVEQLEKEEDIAARHLQGRQGQAVHRHHRSPTRPRWTKTLPCLFSARSWRARRRWPRRSRAGRAALHCPVLPQKEGDAAAQQFHYEGYDIITLQKLIERDYTIPEPQTLAGGHLLLRQAHRPGCEAAVAVRRAGAQSARVPGNEGVRRDRSRWTARP